MAKLPWYLARSTETVDKSGITLHLRVSRWYWPVLLWQTMREKLHTGELQVHHPWGWCLLAWWYLTSSTRLLLGIAIP